MNWKKGLLLHFAVYVIDMTVAMLGFILAFGLTVKSWFWLIVLPLISRFLIHTINSALMRGAYSQGNLESTRSAGATVGTVSAKTSSPPNEFQS